MSTIYVITVCRNAEALLEDTILSVLGQTYPNVRYIIIDGASTDGTVDIIKKYQDRLAYWVSEPDKGIYDAMNKGLAAARSQEQSLPTQSWVNFMNAGDTFASNTILSDIFGEVGILSSQEQQSAIQVIGGHTNRVYSSHVELYHAVNPEEIYREIPYSHQSTFVRLFADNNWTFDLSYKIAADYKVVFDIYQNYGPSAFLSLDFPIANYRMEGSTSFVNIRETKGEYLRIQSAHRTWRWWKEYIKWRCL